MADSEFEYLDAEDLIDLTVAMMGDPPPIRDIGLLGSAAARPATTAYGEDAYVGLWYKAAALLQSIVKNHPLVDGNKRLGWLATASFLEINGVEILPEHNDSAYELVMSVAATDQPVEWIAERLKQMLGPAKP